LSGHSIAGGIAIGTVLLPEMSRRITANDHDGAISLVRN
jgi:putative peptidoglycan lipid II flippase